MKKKKRKETKNTMFGTGKVLDKEGGGNVLIKPIKVCISMCISFGGVEGVQLSKVKFLLSFLLFMEY